MSTRPTTFYAEVDSLDMLARTRLDLIEYRGDTAVVTDGVHTVLLDPLFEGEDPFGVPWVGVYDFDESSEVVATT